MACISTSTSKKCLIFISIKTCPHHAKKATLRGWCKVYMGPLSKPQHGLWINCLESEKKVYDKIRGGRKTGYEERNHKYKAVSDHLLHNHSIKYGSYVQTCFPLNGCCNRRAELLKCLLLKCQQGIYIYINKTYIHTHSTSQKLTHPLIQRFFFISTILHIVE